MLLAKIVGTVVATRKDPRLVSNKLLVVRPIDPRGKADGNYLVAIDTVDAGVGETVLIVSGSSARMASGLKDCPVDAAVVGIIDNVDIIAGIKLLLVQPLTPGREPAGRPLVAVDSVGAGVGEEVFFVRGKEASFPFFPVEPPVDAGIVGIVDHWDVG